MGPVDLGHLSLMGANRTSYWLSTVNAREWDCTASRPHGLMIGGIDSSVCVSNVLSEASDSENTHRSAA